ncbi:MAG: hypothetical protein WDW36_010069 [Sanguina aurantia]
MPDLVPEVCCGVEPAALRLRSNSKKHTSTPPHPPPLVFFATIGACANVPLVLRNAPALFGFSAIALATHLALILGLGRLLNFSLRDILLASNANIGGPSTVAGMAAAKGWRSALVPVILTSTLGYSLGTFVGLTLGRGCLCFLGT